MPLNSVQKPSTVRLIIIAIGFEDRTDVWQDASNSYGLVKDTLITRFGDQVFIGASSLTVITIQMKRLSKVILSVI